MRISSLVCGLLSLTSSVFGHALPSTDNNDLATLEKRQGGFTPVTGPGGPVRPRLEIREMRKKGAQWNIFLLAMNEWMNQPQSQKLSYYQIAGIHGVPRQSWDGVGRCGNCGGQVDGYCPHDSILFLGWHRAYVALFEQEIIRIAKNIANQFSGNQRNLYRRAANHIRLPYWDWAAKPPGANVLPQSLTAKRVTLTTPNGRKTITNPLYQYTFKDTSGMVYGAYKTYKNTLRYPQSSAANAGSNERKAIQAFNNIQGSMQDRVYQMFSTCDEFVEVGSDAKGTSSSKCSNSIEGIHNTIHTTAGGPRHNGIAAGHMSILSTAAFDPIFWLHHCNVDRLFALWQTMYPNSYRGSQRAPHTTWTIPSGSVQNLNSPLTPFHRDTSGNFLTTHLVRDWTKFSYTYPEFSKSDGSRNAIANSINKLYGPNASGTAGSTKKRSALPQADANTTSTSTSTTASEASAAASASASAAADLTPLIAQNGSLYQYVANVQTPRYALSSTYNIYLFNNDPVAEDPSEWLLDPNLIGPIGVITSEDMNADVQIVESVPLTRTLSAMVDQGILGSLNQILVVPYLKQSLKWRIVGSDGTVINPADLKGFEVSVYASTATQPAEFELPTWSEFIPLAEITENKAGGATLQSIIDDVTTTLGSVLGVSKS